MVDRRICIIEVEGCSLEEDDNLFGSYNPEKGRHVIIHAEGSMDIAP